MQFESADGKANKLCRLYAYLFFVFYPLDTMYWSRPKVYGDPPPSCRAHSSTLVDKRLFIFGGGDGPIYFNDLYVFDTGMSNFRTR